MVQARKDPGRPAAPVAESWRRIEAWLEEYLPAVKATLNPGIAKKDLAKFEKLVGRRLPGDVRQSWLIHDGQGSVPGEFYSTDDPVPLSTGLLFGQELRPLGTGSGRSRGSVLAEWERWKELIEGEADPKSWDEFDEACSSSPAGAIRLKYSHPGWLPLASLTSSNSVGVDLDPGPDGIVGQVINFGRDEHEKYVLAASWAQFLEDFADELEAGNFVIDLEEPGGEFRMREPNCFTASCKAWARAKSGPGIPPGGGPA